jgi:hypothetical protein
MKQPIEFRTALLILFSVTILLGRFSIYKFQTISKNPASILNTTTTPSTVQTASTSTITTSTVPPSVAAPSSSAIICTTDFSGFAIPPLPTSSYNWTIITPANATSAYGGMPGFSSSTGEIINPEPFYAQPFESVSTTLEGQGWFSQGATQIPQGYYQPLLTQEGWTGQLNIASETLYGMVAGGYHGIVWGMIKVENGYFRTMEIDESTGVPDPTNINIFVSDIVPLSQIIPGYTPGCPIINAENLNSTGGASSPAPYPPIWGEYHASYPDRLMLVNAAGQRTGADPLTGTIYREIPGTNYTDQGSNGPNSEVFTSNLPNGQYTLYLLGGVTGSYWIDLSHDGTRGQLFQGIIQKGAMVSFIQNYDASNLANSTFSSSTTFSSFGWLTSAPPNNLPLGE